MYKPMRMSYKTTVLNGHYLLLTEQNKKKYLGFSVYTCICVCVLSIAHTGFLSEPVFLKVKVCDVLNLDYVVAGHGVQDSTMGLFSEWKGWLSSNAQKRAASVVL